MVEVVSVLSLEADVSVLSLVVVVESELSLVVEVVSVLSLEADVSVLSLVVVDESELSLEADVSVLSLVVEVVSVLSLVSVVSVPLSLINISLGSQRLVAASKITFVPIIVPSWF